MNNQLYIPITFKKSSFVINNKNDATLIAKFSDDYNGKQGFFVLKPGGMSRSLAQNRFYRGPIIDAYVELTGTANRDYWHSYLSSMFLTKHLEDGKEYIKSTASLSVHEFKEYLQNCLDLLAEQGGCLMERQWEEWIRI